MSLLIPSCKSGFARNAAESEYPNLWDGLVGLWAPFLGPTGLTLFDWGGRKNHGMLTNMDPATDWVATEKGWALDVLGATQRIQHTAPFHNVSAFSFTLWIYPFTDDCDYLGKWSGFNNPGGDTQHLLRGTTQWDWFVRNAADSANTSVSSVGNIVVNAWSFVAGVADGSNLILYIRGAATETSSSAFAGPYIPPSNDLWAFGRAHNTGTPNARYAMGSYYNRALPLDEIQQLYVDPHALLTLRQEVFASTAAPSFSAAWADRVNQHIGLGV